ncbi:MAG: diphthine--ammonia ligase [Bacteroidota bacterium]
MSRIPISVSWSGGKDSAFMLHKLLESDLYDIKNLHTVFDADLKRVGLHGIREELIAAQADALGLPLEKLYLTKSDDHNNYEQLVTDFYSHQRKEGIAAIAFGDIFLEDLKAYRDNFLTDAGLKGVYPIWGYDTSQLVNDFLKAGFKTRICAANSAFFTEEQVGETLTEAMVANFPAAVDPCGENGEFHTFVFDGPIFKTPVSHGVKDAVSKTYTYNKQTASGDIEEINTTFWFREIVSS